MRKSRVAHLPREVRKEIEKRWREGSFTLDALMEWLREAAPEGGVSRSGLGRYVAQYNATFTKIREAQEVAARCVEQLGENPRGEVGQLLCQMLSALAVNTLNQMGGADEPVDSKELFFLSSALKNLASADKTNMDRVLKLRTLLAEKKEAAAAKAAGAAKAGGLSAEGAEAIRQAILEINV